MPKPRMYSADEFKPLDDPIDDLGAVDSKVQDEQTKAMLFDGASISQLARLFGHDNRTIAKKIQGLRPVGKRAGHPIYAVAEAARYLVVPLGDIEDHIRKMRPEELPAGLQREFWGAQAARLKFEEDRGDLWRTADVIAHYSETFMTMRTALLLMVDTVEKSVELTDRQRAIIQRSVDGAMKELHTSLVRKFEHEPERSFDSHPEDQANSGEEPKRTVDQDDDPTADL